MLFQSQRTIHLHGLFTGCHQSAISPVLSFIKYETTTVAIITNGVYITSTKQMARTFLAGHYVLCYKELSCYTKTERMRNPAYGATKQSEHSPTYMPTEHKFHMQCRALHHENVCVYFPLYEFQRTIMF